MDRPPPEECQPQLRWYSHLWRILLMLAISVGVWFTVADGQSDRIS
ncbi:MAG: hypothetical protein M3237_05615 [Actinomycetota bacterium]|nr:hypothetical protein [Actinomycetota bacterium]